MKLRTLLTGAAVVALVAWLALRPQPGPDPRLVEREFLSMGTILNVSVYLDADQDRAAAEDALGAVETLINDYAQRWSAWGSGALGQLNQRLAAGETVQIPPELQPLFRSAAERTHLSGGLFDVRIGRIVALWGFNDETQFHTAPPDRAALEALRAALAAAPPLPADATQYGPAPGVWLDFGATAKGDATDLAIAELRRRGYPDAIVNAGGNLHAAGRRGDRPWRIGIRHPRPDDNHRVLATLEIAGDEAVITSGDYERYFDHDGRRYHHLLDPRTGEPAQGLQSVTVVAPTGAFADGATTALFVAGPQHWRETAAALGATQAMVVLDDGRVQVTAALAPRLAFADGIQVETVP